MSMTLNGVPKKVLQGVAFEEAFANVTATVQYEQGVSLDVKFEDTARAVSALRYGRHMPLRSDLRTARSAFGTLRSRLGLPQKGLLALRYACAFRHPRLRHGKEK